MFLSLTRLHYPFSVLSGKVNVCWRCVSNFYNTKFNYNISLNIYSYTPHPHGATEPSGPGPPYYKAFLSYSDTPQSVGFLWTCEQSDAETSIREHTILDPPGRIRTCNPSKRGAADSRLRPRGHSDLLNVCGLFYCVSMKLWRLLGHCSSPG